jgi:hypothetical protein
VFTAHLNHILPVWHTRSYTHLSLLVRKKAAGDTYSASIHSQTPHNCLC